LKRQLLAIPIKYGKPLEQLAPGAFYMPKAVPGLLVLSTTGNVMTTGCMAIAAVGLVEFFTNINRMDKVRHLLAHRDILLNLIQHLMTNLAIL